MITNHNWLNDCFFEIETYTAAARRDMFALGFHSTKVIVSSNLIVFTQRQVETSQNRNVLSSLPETKTLRKV